MTAEIVKDYLRRFPNTPSNALAKAIYADHWDKFKNTEAIRGLIRVYRGRSGDRLRKAMKSVEFFEQKPVSKYNIPSGDKRDFVPYYLPKANDNILVLSDMHFPYHDETAIEVALDWGVSKGINTIVLNGDIMDCYQLSKFIKDPSARNVKEEVYMLKEFLSGITKALPNVKFYYKMGNHEERFENFMKVKAPELFGIEEFQLQYILHLREYGIEYIGDKRKIMAGKLPILHGHEVGMKSGGVNPARGLYLKTKKSSMCGHFHQSSEHSANNIDSELSTTFSMGCLCDLHPEYAPYNDWNHGFTHVKVYDDLTFRVFNARMYNHKIL